jgi:hypothetical protein
MTRSAAVLASIALTVALAAACGDDETASPATTIPTTTVAEITVPTTVPAESRTVSGRIVEIYAASASFEIDEVEILSGDEALAAAREAGVIGPDEDLPNDFYILDRSTDTERFTVSPDATVWIYDCSGGCELTEVALADFLNGRIEPFGGDGAVWTVDITDGVATAIAEVYLP